MQALQTALPKRPHTSSIASPRGGRAARMRRAYAELVTLEDLSRKLSNASPDERLSYLKKILKKGVEAGDQWLAASGADGLGPANLLRASVDTILKGLFAYHAHQQKNTHADIALFAIGGYGRGVLAPHSDIDLMFVYAQDHKDTPLPFVEAMLHTLWDLGLKVGHACRLPEECAKLAYTDHTVRTALLDRRFLAGDPELIHQLNAKMEQEDAHGKSSDFIADKLRERDRRHTAKGSSRYRVEPDIKNGKGGLRDLQTLFWIVRHLYGGQDLEQVLRSPAFTKTDATRFRNQTRFLWAVRWHLHRLTGRATECLSFDLQPELATRMGYTSRKALSGVERFMKRYFLATREVGALTRILCAKLEEQDRTAPRGLFGLLPPPAPQDTPEFSSFTRDAGRVNIKQDTAFEQDPVNMLRLFVLTDKTGLDIHPDAMSRIRQTVSAFPVVLRKDEEARKLFLKILTSPRHPGRTLQLMNETGLLGRFVPEFGRIVAQTQYNMYHHFTVDDHTLRAISLLNDLERKRLSDTHPLATELFAAITHRRALYLAILLHDTGKGQGDQLIHGGRNARSAATRLGLPPQEIDLVVWLVEHHLEMSATAQRRDIADPETIIRFVSIVGSVERLRLLFLMTVADICAVGPGVWNEWKRHLLTMLYEASAAALSDGRSGNAGALLEQRRIQINKTRDKLTKKLKRLPDYLDGIEDAYWVAFSEDEQLWHGQALAKAEQALAQQTEHTDLPVHGVARSAPDTDSTAILIAAPDRPDLFMRLAAPIAHIGANLVAARLYSCRNGGALDLFEIQSDAGEPLCKETTARLIEAMRHAAGSTGDLPQTPPPPHKIRAWRGAAFIVSPEIAIDRTCSTGHLVIEVSGRDRPGLMLDVARVLARRNLSIVSAYAENFGVRAHEVFYVTSYDHDSLPPVSGDKALRKALYKAVAQNQPDAPRIRAKKLKRAAVSGDR